MATPTLSPVPVQVLAKQYEKYIKKEKAKWLSENNKPYRPFEPVYEVMNNRQRQRVHEKLDSLKNYVTTLTEAWWRERGYECQWPKEDSEPMGVRPIR